MIPLDSHGDDAIAQAWNAHVPARYRVDKDLVRLNLFDHPLLHSRASGWNDEGFVAVKRSAAELYEGPNPKVAHLSLFTPLCSGLLAQVKSVLLEEGYESLVIGQDSGHFLPGAPVDVPWMGLNLREMGFENGNLAFDVERDLGEFIAEHLSGDLVCRPLTDADRPLLNEFLLREFPGRWRYDVLGKFDWEGPSTVFGLFSPEGCEGFALLQTDGCRKPIGGAVWRNGLGAGWASLGPIGISRSMRGSGVGRAFLSQALSQLQSRGARQTIIDWTVLLDFYGTQGFNVSRAYRSYRLPLRVDPQPEA